MIILLGDIMTVAVIGLIVLRKGRDEYVGRGKVANGLMIAGLLVLSLQVAIYLIFAMGQMSDGDLSGAAHLAPAATKVIFGFLAWKRPLEGGVGLFLLGALNLIFYGLGILLMIWPLPLSGLLFMISAVLAHNTNGHSFGRPSMRSPNE